MAKNKNTSKWDYWSENSNGTGTKKRTGSVSSANAPKKNVAAGNGNQAAGKKPTGNKTAAGNTGNAANRSRTNTKANANNKYKVKKKTAQPKAEHIKTVKTARRRRKGMSTGAIVALCLLAVLFVGAIGVYLYQGAQYQNTFIKGVTINSIDCEGKTVEQVESEIAQSVEQYALTIQFRGDQTATIQGQDIDYKYVSDGNVQKIMDDQNWVLWGESLWKTTDYKVGEEISYSQEKLTAVLSALPQMQADAQVAPENSIIVYENGEFSVSEAVQGSQINTDTFMAGVEQAVQSSTPTISVEELQAYAVPEITSDNQLLNENKDILNQYAKASITYTLPDGTTRTLDGVTLIQWMSVDANNHYYKDEATFTAKLKEYVNQLAKDYDTLENGITFTDANGKTVTVKGGTYGWSVDTSSEIKQLTEDIASLGVVEREPIYSNEGTATGNGGVGNTYLECDLGNQVVYYVQDGEIVWQSDCVSGRYSIADRRTPEGVYAIYNKQTNRTLKGEQQADGSYSYESFVNYWMPFYKGYGLHDATWRSSFGGSIYRYSGSHGCVNLPVSKAKTLYNLISVGTIVILYY